ncbi:MAG: hypothetical protein KZQ92_09510 [Candidatus Thiodiazotropha sp. (ex Lucinoma borealis)]|nr:hypothetical protein [Candidatus Thiodiazotropha sp. (ex Lucinoma borealis)]
MSTFGRSSFKQYLIITGSWLSRVVGLKSFSNNLMFSAAEDGSPFAQRIAGGMCLAGISVPLDPEKGMKYLRGAASAGEDGAVADLKYWEEKLPEIQRMLDNPEAKKEFDRLVKG